MAKQTPPINRIFLLNIIGQVALAIAFLGLWRYADRPQIPQEMQIAASALKRNDLPAARAQFEKFLAQRPDSPEQYVQVLVTCQTSKRPDLMALYAQRSIQDCKYAPDGQRSVLYGLLAAAYDLTEKPPKLHALEAADRAFHLDTESPANLNRLGYMMVDNLTDSSSLIIGQGYISRALRALKDQSGEVDPNALAGYQASFGWALYKRGLFKESVSALLEAITNISDTTPDGENIKFYYYHLGAAYHKTGRIREAKQALDAALQYDPKFDLAIAERASLPPVPAAVEPPADPSTDDVLPDTNIKATPAVKRASNSTTVVPNSHAGGTTIGAAPGTLVKPVASSDSVSTAPTKKSPIVPLKTPGSPLPSTH